MVTRATATVSLRRWLHSGLVALALAWPALPAAADDFADFQVALARATTDYDAAMHTIDHGSREEATAAVSRLRQSCQTAAEQFRAAKPAAFAGDKTLGAAFVQVDAGLVGALLVIEMGSRDAARAALAPIAETLARLRVRPAPSQQ
jgi:hypothetical protein